MSGFVNRGPRKTEFSTGRRIQLAIRGIWMIGLGVAGLVAAYLQR